MRLRRLDLIRYGRFEDVSLNLPAVPLVVVHGPNEAGKSTALHAIDDLLFGFGHSTAFDFRFKAGELRLGAEVEARDGRVLAFRRRKGRARTLLGADEAPLDDAALDPFLGGCTRELFHQLFGLDAPRLREGGARLLKDGGALGESLLSAGAALRDASSTRRALEEEADLLFAPRKAAGRRFWQAEARFQTARTALRGAIRSPEALHAAQAAAAQAGERLAAARATLAVQEAADRADRRLASALPVLARLAALRAERAALDAPEAASAGLGARLDAALAEAQAAADGRARLAEAAAALAAERARVARPGPALGHRSAIAALQARGGAVAAAEAERPDLAARLAGHKRRLQAIAAALGLAPGDFASLAPSAAALADARALLAEGVRRQDAASAADARLAALVRALSPEPATPSRDPAPARAALERLRAAPGHAREAAARQADAESAAAEAVAAARALVPTPRGPLAAMAVPAAATVAGYIAQAAALARQAVALDAEAAGLARERAALAAAMTDTAGAVPDRAALDAARAARDTAWRALRRVRLEGAQGAAPEPDGYEALVAEADRLADRREAGAKALEAAAQAAAAARRLDAAEADVAARRAALVRETADFEAGWQALWPDLAAPALPPEAMRDWLAARDRAVTLARQAEAAARVAQWADAARTAEAAELAALAEGFAVPPQASLAALVDALDRAVTAAEAAQAVARARAEALRQVQAAQEENEAAQDALSAWHARWTEAGAGLGLSPPPGLEGGATALELWAEALTAREAAAGLAARLDAVAADAVAFAVDAAALAAALGVAPEASPAATVAALTQRLEADIAAEAHHAACDREAAAHATQGAALAAQAARAAAAVAMALTEAGAEGADPAALRDALVARDALDARIAAEAARLREIDAVTPEDALRDALAGLDADALAARIATRAVETAAAQAAHEAAIRAEADAAAALATHDDATAATARQAQADAAAAMAEAGTGWLRLRAATLLLAEATRRYRAQHSDPLLAAAGAALARMTGGALAGLAADLDETDTERLVAVRDNGTRLGVDALSEGARDQLFLSLRIAAIARRCAVAEPVPFVADDLFTSFDDGRTALGLAELARLGAVTQVLVFTHHEAVVEAAAGLGSAAAVLRLQT